MLGGDGPVGFNTLNWSTRHCPALDNFIAVPAAGAWASINVVIFLLLLGKKMFGSCKLRAVIHRGVELSAFESP